MISNFKQQVDSGLRSVNKTVEALMKVWVEGMGWTWTLKRFTKARHARAFYALRAGHP
jgi:hypothetical protein